MATAVTITPRPEIICAGIKVQTAMDKAHKDCPELWEKFQPFMGSFPANPTLPGESFGVCIMTDEMNFEYWAVLPLAPGAAVPEGMEQITLPAGDYAESAPITLKEMGDTFSYIYGEWITTQSGYTLNMRGACYEKYTPEFMKNGTLTVYCPLIKK